MMAMSETARTGEIRQGECSGEMFAEIAGLVAPVLYVGRLGGDRCSKFSEQEGYRRWTRGGGIQLISECLRRLSAERFQFRGRRDAGFLAGFRSGIGFMGRR